MGKAAEAPPRFAPPHDRILALVIDAALLVASSPFTLGVAAIVLRGLWPAAALALATSYLTLSYVGGQTPGMHLVGMHITSEDGHAPHTFPAAVRAILVLGPVAAGLALASSQVSVPDSPARGLSSLEFWAGSTMVASGIFDHAWALRDRQRRALHDVLTGLAVRNRPTAR